MSHSQRLQPFLLLSKSVKGIANAKLIQDVMSAPGVYVFTELYELPNLVQVKTKETQLLLY
jgi:COP9 signalosome complex subunit 7